jgi:hypothetical protein
LRCNCILRASTERDLDTVFVTVAQLRAGALLIGGDAFFASRSGQVATLAARHSIPTISGRIRAAHDIRTVVVDWVNYLRTEKLWGLDVRQHDAEPGPAKRWQGDVPRSLTVGRGAYGPEEP